MLYPVPACLPETAVFVNIYCNLTWTLKAATSTDIVAWACGCIRVKRGTIQVSNTNSGDQLKNAFSSKET